MPTSQTPRTTRYLSPRYALVQSLPSEQTNPVSKPHLQGLKRSIDLDSLRRAETKRGITLLFSSPPSRAHTTNRYTGTGTCTDLRPLARGASVQTPSPLPDTRMRADRSRLYSAPFLHDGKPPREMHDRRGEPRLH